MAGVDFRPFGLSPEPRQSWGPISANMTKNETRCRWARHLGMHNMPITFRPGETRSERRGQCAPQLVDGIVPVRASQDVRALPGRSDFPLSQWLARGVGRRVLDIQILGGREAQFKHRRQGIRDGPARASNERRVAGREAVLSRSHMGMKKRPGHFVGDRCCFFSPCL